MDIKKPNENEQCGLCGRWNNRPIGVDMVIFKDEKVLLIKRATDPDAGKYALPGGYLDRDETVEEGAIREVKEETGLDVEITKLIGIRSGSERFRQIVEIGFIGKVVGGTEINGDGVAMVEWFDPNNITVELSMDHGEILKNALKVYSN